jgi:hypothetical protein
MAANAAAQAQREAERNAVPVVVLPDDVAALLASISVSPLCGVEMCKHFGVTCVDDVARMTDDDLSKCGLWPMDCAALRRVLVKASAANIAAPVAAPVETQEAAQAAVPAAIIAAAAVAVVAAVVFVWLARNRSSLA